MKPFGAASACVWGLVWLAFAPAGCVQHGPRAAQATPTPATARPTPAPSGVGNGSASPAPAATSSAVKVTVHGRKVGSRYVVLTEHKGSREVYAVRADSESGQYFGADTASSEFINPHVTFFGRHGERLVADAPLGAAAEKDKSIRMSGGVHARTADGKTLTSDTLRYVDPTETIYSDGNVVLTSPSGDRLEGDHLVWDMRTGHIDVTGAGAAK